MPDLCYTAKETAALLHCNVKLVRQLIRSGRLQAIALSAPPRTEYRIPAESLTRLLHAEDWQPVSDEQLDAILASLPDQAKK